MADLIQPAGVLLDATVSSREEAVALSGTLLMQLGAVTEQYRDAMWEREQIFPSEIGAGFAIPHGTDASRVHVLHDQLAFIRLTTPITWVSEEVSVVIGIASQGEGHVDLLGNLADILLDEESSEVLRTSGSAEQICELLMKGI
jgi:mannitol/fructose-specific phosphotransferase system IIA component